MAPGKTVFELRGYMPSYVHMMNKEKCCAYTWWHPPAACAHVAWSVNEYVRHTYREGTRTCCETAQAHEASMLPLKPRWCRSRAASCCRVVSCLMLSRVYAQCLHTCAHASLRALVLFGCKITFAFRCICVHVPVISMRERAGL
jgi:hypothetical protein